MCRRRDFSKTSFALYRCEDCNFHLDRFHCVPVLTQRVSPPNIHVMAHSFLVFDFGANEEAAQQARHRIEAWKQGFRLDKKLQVKFERNEAETTPEAAPASPPKAAKSG